MSACSELKDVIADLFAFLANGGYRTVYEDERGTDGCVVGLEGHSIRIKFYTARDERLNILVGSGTALFDVGTGKDGDAGWYYIRGIAGYLDHDLSIGERFASRSYKEWSGEQDDQESNLARLLEGHIDGIERIFAAGFEKERSKYEQYITAVDARTRSAYESGPRKH